MLAVSNQVRVFVCRQATNMRCSFAGLVSRSKHVIEEDPLSGHLFVFFNRRCDYCKVLYWDRSGYCIWSKRLEVGTFEMPSGAGTKVEIDVKKLMLILEGISLESVKQRRRYLRKSNKE